MKTFKFLFVAVLLSFFASGISFAQNSKTVESTTISITDYPLWCMGEYLNGDISYSLTTWESGKILEKFKGELIGEITGNVYTISQVLNSNWVPYDGEGQFSASWILTLSIE